METETTWAETGGLPVAMNAMSALVLRYSSMNQITLAAGPKVPCWAL